MYIAIKNILIFRALKASPSSQLVPESSEGEAFFETAHQGRASSS